VKILNSHLNTQWIWQDNNWPDFQYDAQLVIPVLEQTVRSVSPLCTLAKNLSQDKQLQLESEVLLDEALASAKIEGEILNRESVRSSIANKLGLGKDKNNLQQQASKSDEAYLDILLESIRNIEAPLTEKQLLKWHSMMFIDHPVLYDMIIGDYRNESMTVVSGRFGKQTTHFIAPCEKVEVKECVKKQMTAFFTWLNQRQEGKPAESGYVRAAIAKLWFVTIHPLDDGNGRFSRIIAEYCLAQTEALPLRLYSISSQIESNRNEYYEILEATQRGNLDITRWTIWFLQQVDSAAQTAMILLNRINSSTQFWDHHRHTEFNPRQKKLLERMLEEGAYSDGISRKKYKKLVHTSDITATRDLQDLVEKNVMQTKGAGRNVVYCFVHSEPENNI